MKKILTEMHLIKPAKKMYHLAKVVLNKCIGGGYKVSVVCPFYKNDAFVEKTIDSVLAQTYKNFELILVLNGASDFNQHLKQKYIDKKIVFVEFTENQGSYWGVEYGIKKATGGFIAFIGSDDWWANDKLEKQISIVKKQKDVGAVFFTPSLVDASGNAFVQDGLFVDAPDFNGDRFHELHQFFYHMNGLCWSSALIEKRLLSKSSWKLGRYKQLCDKKHWLNCLEKKCISVLPDKNKVFYRIHTNNECLSNLNKIHNKCILENAFLLKKYLCFSPSVLNKIFENELKEENQKFTNENKAFMFVKMCKKNTNNPIVNRSLDFLGSLVWFEEFEKNTFSNTVKTESLSNNEALEVFPPNCFDVRI